MFLMYYIDIDTNQRVYTLAKTDPYDKPTLSAHPARFSPDDKFSKYRIKLKKRFVPLIYNFTTFLYELRLQAKTEYTSLIIKHQKFDYNFNERSSSSNKKASIQSFQGSQTSMSIQPTNNSQENIIVEIETLKSIYPTFEEITEENELKCVKLQIRLFPRQTQTSFIAKSDDVNALTVFEIPRDFPIHPVKVYFEEFAKLPWEKTETLRKKIVEFSTRKIQESTVISVSVYVLQIATEIEEGLYHAKHSKLNIWTENRFEKNTNGKLEFINGIDQASRNDTPKPVDSRLLSRTHEIVQVKMKQQGWSRYLARTEQGDLRIIDNFIIDLENNLEQQKGKIHQPFDPEIFRQPLQRLKENQFRVLKNLSHENICSYTDFQFQCTSTQLRIEWIRVYNEAIYLCDLVGRSDEYQLLNLNLLPFQLHKIVTGLHELHECELYHGNLSLSTLCLDQSGGIILLDYFLPSAVFHELTNAGLSTFDSYPFAKNTQTKYEDLNVLGCLTAKIFQNKHELSKDFDENSTIENCPLPLVRFIRKCLQARGEYVNTCGILKLFFQARNTPTCLYDMHGNTSSPRAYTNGYGDSASSGQCDGRSRFSSDVYSGLSRLVGDFKDLGEIGKGGYGRVIKALHKIDQRIYAIKVIKLPPNSEHNNLRQACKREVKMLSQLDHENVVRYYQAWFDVDSSYDETESESESESGSNESNRSSELFTSRDFSQRHRNRRLTPITTRNDNNTASSDVVSFRDGVSSEHSNTLPVINSKSLILTRRGSSLASRCLVDVSIEESVVEEKRDRSSSHSEPTESSEDEQYYSNPVNNILCLQMEYCESDTIEQLISENLYQKEEEVLRLFREMMEGLNYIHNKNLIHRDLKPANIFVDSEKHVKIGDFGLAMSVGVESNGINCVAGTMHYLAPELLKGKVKYTQKVDIYSIGLIFFEMNCPPFGTISEKINVFSQLKEKIYPKDFQYSITDLPCQIITQMLSRDPNKRPAAKEIIMKLPPKLADASFQEALRKVLEKPDSTRFRNVLNTIFTQKSLVESKMNIPSNMEAAQTMYDSFVSKHSIFDRIYELMAKHGAIQIDLPNFYNRSLIQRPVFEAIHMLSDQGSVLSMPFDLRVPFTAFIARNNIEHDMKTFCIGKIYRQNNFDATTVNSVMSTNTNFSLAPQGPEERFEMICDIISPPTYNCLVEAEILLVTMDILLTFEAFNNDSFCIYLSHSKLLDALLEQYEMNESERRNILQILLKHGPSSSPITKRKNSAKGFTKLKDLCQAYTHGSGLCRSLVRNYEMSTFEQEFLKENPNLKDNLNFQTALKDIKLLLKHLKGIPNQFSLSISPGVINYLNTEGLLFQVSLTSNSESTNSSYPCNDDILLATGMMHQNLIAKFRNSKQYPKHAFGVRIDLQECIDREKNIVSQTNFDCVVVPFDSDSNTISDSFSIVKDLWKRQKLRCEVLKYAEYENKSDRFWEKDRIPLIICVENRRGSKKSRLKLKMFDLKESKFIEYEVLQENICDEVTKFFEKHEKSRLNLPQNRIQFQVISNKRSVIGLEEQTVEKLKTVTQKFENFDTIHIIATDLDTKALLGFIYDLHMKTESAKLTCLGNDNRQNRIINEMKKFIDNISKNQTTTKRLLILYSLTDEKHHIIDCLN
ncbi:Eukaryotic translation initiation factor 2-alpha kinase 4 [Oopsacas minuta]|uniref:non-specific serine/threonine protein kinase n=1 Tax=Oopsacas minuta TaxID=111878 RepID=A0AAV7K939_9METZ|nr:Eukaryotic translation initiation factor 2-alpha kinase 4 [Oopsacas minuta]